MRFLKEQPRDNKKNAEYFFDELTTPHVALKSIGLT
jgi:hypothetical protein